MSDLISRRALIEALQKDKEAVYSHVFCHTECQFEDELADDLEQFINNQPTIEAKEVVHGRIIYKIDIPHCSVCGKVIHGASNYCRHCGAKLDLPECGANMKGGAE